jgi:hypothetical protein
MGFGIVNLSGKNVKNIPKFFCILNFTVTFITQIKIATFYLTLSNCIFALLQNAKLVSLNLILI